MKKIGVIVNPKRPRADDILCELRALAKQHAITLYAEDAEMAEILDATHLPIQDFSKEVEAVLAMGGDGTVLYAARALYGASIPIMGINLGSLGFLTSVSDADMAKALESMLMETCIASPRELAECRIYRSGKEVGVNPALNDVVLGWGASSRIVTLELLIDGESVASFMCDGMMVSTPTGSTGHALSSGGPILHPEVAGFGVNVICPHTLSSRPLVIPHSCEIEIRIVQTAKELILSIDGQDEYRMEQGDHIHIKRSAYPIPFLQLPGFSYFSVLAQKLHWRGSAL